MKFDKLQALLAKLNDGELADFEVSPWSSFATSSSKPLQKKSLTKSPIYAQHTIIVCADDKS